VVYQINPLMDGPWRELDRCHVADGLQAIVTDPCTGVGLNQAMLPLCGPVAWWNVVASRHPVAVAQAGVDLYEKGQAMLGGLLVKPDPAVFHAPLLQKVNPDGTPVDPSVGGPNTGNLGQGLYWDASGKPTSNWSYFDQDPLHQRATQAAWMLAGSLPKLPGTYQPDPGFSPWLESLSAHAKVPWKGNPHDMRQGGYYHEDLVSLFSQTGFFASLNDSCVYRTNSSALSGAVSQVVFGGGADYIALIQGYLMVAATDPQGKSGLPASMPNQPDWKPGLHTPNHWIVMLQPPDSDGQFVTFGAWTWGEKHLNLRCSVADWMQYYHGCIGVSI